MTTLTQVTLSLPPEERTEDTGAAVVVARTGSISVVRAHGPLGGVAGEARDAALVELAEAPAAVVCDLSRVTGPHEPCAVSLLASLGAHPRHWPGTPLGVLCPDDALRRALEREVLSRHLQVAASQSLLWPLLSEGAATATVRESLVLAPTARAARAARDLVSRACLDWGRSSQIQAATLVVSELVTNAMVHAGTDLEVSVTRCGPRLRVAVKDHSRRVPRLQDAGSAGVTGRGMVLVDAFSESWRVLPTGDGGKVVWAVILERARTAPARSRSADERPRVARRVHPDAPGRRGGHP
jgi:anti-sigma regulatory factor (Ser/Thr protein kinase)